MAARPTQRYVASMVRSRGYVEENEVVFVMHSRFHVDRPTYHRGRRLDEVNGTYRIRTGCGYEARSYDPRSRRFFDTATALPAKWALQFADPCLRCWPEGPVVLTSEPPATEMELAPV